MFLNDDLIQSTYIKEAFSPTGQRQSVLLIMTQDNLDEVKVDNPKAFHEFVSKLEYLDTLAKDGFFDFDRIEVTQDTKKH